MTTISLGGVSAAIAKIAVVVSALLLAGTLVPRMLRQEDARPTVTVALAEPAPAARVRSGTETIVFFVGSSTCGASQHPNLPAALRATRAKLGSEASAAGKRFIYAGVAVDEDPFVGLSFLEKFGPFNEVLSGGSWINTGAVALMIRDAPGPLALPQLVIVERDVEAGQSSISVSPDRIVARIVGFEEIFRFAGVADSMTFAP